MEIIPSSGWLPRAGKPLIIAGPCSAESEEQLRNVAGVLSQDDRVHLMRAGIWKPRTSPNSFEGMGEKALPWVKTVSEEFDLPFIIEAAKASHVEAALQQGLKYLWIGAQTTVNPFSTNMIILKRIEYEVSVFNGLTDVEDFLLTGIVDFENDMGMVQCHPKWDPLFFNKVSDFFDSPEIL